MADCEHEWSPLEFEDGEKSKASVCSKCGALKSGQGTMVITTDYIDFSPLTANPTLAEGRQWFRSDKDSIYWCPDGTTIEKIQTKVWAEKIEGSLAGIKSFLGSVEGAEGASWNFTMNPSAGVWIKQYSTDACFNCQMVYHGAYQHWTGNNTFVDVPNKADNVYGAGEVAVAHQTPDGTVTKSWASPIGDGRGVDWDGQYVLLAGHLSNHIYKFTPAGTQKAAVDVSPNQPSDVCWDGTYLWFTTGAGPGQVYQIQKDVFTQVSHFSGVGGNATGIDFDGEYLWCASAASNTVYKFTPAGVQKGAFNPAFGPWGVAWDGEYLWTCAPTGWVYQFTPAGTQKGSWASPGPQAIGSAWDGKYLWVSDLTADAVYQTGNVGNFDLDYRIAPA